MPLKKIVLLFCLVCAVMLGSCGDGDITVEYTFNNKSSYTIQITLSEPYANDSSSDAAKTTYPFSVYQNNERTVYVKRNDVNFYWTTSYAGDNAKVYCVVDGSKATFRNR